MTENMASALIITIFFVNFAFLSGIDGLRILGGPLHASCKVEWVFGDECSVVKAKLIDQIQLWNGPTNCDNGGEKCLYTLDSQTDTEIKAHHVTPVKHYRDNFSFELRACGASQCCAKGSSESGVWYAHLDYGTNYCNMRNLINGAQLDKAAGFKETTSNSICTQYSTADCNKY